MAEHGGYRKPGKPAAVSGPGALSQRTDGRPQPVRDLPDAQYGENAQYRDIQSGAPMSSAPQAPTPAGGAGGGDPTAGMVGLDAPSAMPHVPVTDGADAGAGAGSDALNLPTGGIQDELKVIGKYLPVMIKIADGPDATPAYRAYVRRLLGGAT